MKWWVAVSRLASILAGVGLVTTRLGLVLHELVGHGGTAIALGGTVTDVRLFWFAGGWIRYDLPASTAAHVAASMGGIAIETLIGTTLWVFARRDSLGAKIARTTGAATVAHAMAYLASGTFHGFGDGWILRNVLADGARYAVAIVAGAIAIAFTYAGARSILGVLAALVPNRKLAGIAVAAVLAGGLQAALAFGEVYVRSDATYGAIMQPERERIVAREMAEWDRAHPNDPSRAAHERELAAKHRELPFKYILVALMLAAVVAGALRARPGTQTEIPPKLVMRMTAFAAAAVVLVIAIDAALF